MRFIYTLIIILLSYLQIFSQVNRSFDGVGNNTNNTIWGSVGASQLSITTIGFSDGISLPAGQDRPNPRVISNTIFVQEGSVPDQIGLSDYNFAWGQFIDHDITLVLDNHAESMNIDVPKYDPWMDPQGGGQAIIPLSRSVTMAGTGTDVNNPRHFPNAITAFMDAGTVYGSDVAKSNWLRTFEGGRLRTSEGNLLPYNTIDGEKSSNIDPSAPEMAMLPGTDKFFVAGDIRANENVLLTSLHTVFMREHNRICYELATTNITWDDEKIYQRARKLVGAIVQSISYNEWLPTLGVDMGTYSGYDETVNPQIYNVFSSAAYRYGHTTINSGINRLDNYANELGDGQMTLKDAFFNPGRIEEMGGIDPFIKGMCMQQEQDFDCKMIDDLRNFLFGPPGAGGMDLSAINIQRGRERGLPDYNTIRADFGLEKYTDFNQISDDGELVSQLYSVYGSVDNIDAWVGMLAERHMDNSLFGSLVLEIMTRQFRDLRDGDRYFYLNDEALSFAEKGIISKTTLSQIIKRNTGVYSVPDEIFRAETIDDAVRSITGELNNVAAPNWGAVGTNLQQVVTLAFEDGYAQPSGANRPNAREVSNAVFQQDELINDPVGLSDYNFVWGQFVDHDITLVLDEAEERFDIPVPAFDAYFDPDGTGSKTIPLFRSHYSESTGTDASNPRQFPNDITAYLDGSNVYGSNDLVADWIRSFEGGKLKTSEGNMLPFNTINGEEDGPIDPSAPFMATLPGTDKYFVAGDIRANENLLLTSIHTLFMREHNKNCEELTLEYPNWDDEQLYQQARRIVGAKIQAISYNEWIPTMGLGLTPYDGYQEDVKAQIYNSFSAAVYRYGHSVINSQVLRLNEDGTETEEGPTLLRNAFFNPSALSATGSIDPYLMGMTAQVQQDLDCKMIDDLRNFLFGPPGSGGMDLAAINIQRGRERGLSDYNSIRIQMGLSPKSSFAALSSDFTLNQNLYNIYQEMDKIDLYVGILAEDHLPNSIFGELASNILSKQFQDLRDGDRFFFENDRMLSDAEKAVLRQTKLSDIILRNTDLTNVPDLVFIANLNLSSVEAIDNNLSSLKVFPNPTTGVTSIELNSVQAMDATLEIVNLYGQHVYTENINVVSGNQTISIDMTDYITGAYFIYIKTANGIQSAKVIKQ